MVITLSFAGRIQCLTLDCCIHLWTKTTSRSVLPNKLRVDAGFESGVRPYYLDFFCHESFRFLSRMQMFADKEQKTDGAWLQGMGGVGPLSRPCGKDVLPMARRGPLSPPRSTLREARRLGFCSVPPGLAEKNPPCCAIIAGSRNWPYAGRAGLFYLTGQTTWTSVPIERRNVGMVFSRPTRLFSPT